ncbi:MAG: phosphopantetheine-binding protein [Pseudomonadota bacterium]
MNLRIGASFNAAPLTLFAPFWSRLFDAQIKFTVVPPAQLYPEMLRPGGLLQATGNESVIIFVRWCDLAGVEGPSAYAARADEFAELVLSTGERISIILCNDEKNKNSKDEADKRFLTALGDARCQSIMHAEDIFRQYRVQQAIDSASEESAQIPYTMEAFAALSAAMLRKEMARARKPVKMIAADCDQTLWRGVVGEDGVEGVMFEPGHLALQSKLAQQAASGRIIALLSKNDLRDVDAVIHGRADFVLKDDDILAKRIDWRSKGENLSRTASEFGVGENAVLALDDNAIEVAQMRAMTPEAHIVRVPTDSESLLRFVDHLWLFDIAEKTSEDLQRVAMYREEANRIEERQRAPSLLSFFETLELSIQINDAAQEALARLAQLTVRTNQFNFNLRRFSEKELSGWRSQQGRSLHQVSVSDRFGDYGIVGCFGLTETQDTIDVEFFLLSCRALGRGVEHAMAAYIGETALRRKIETVSFSIAEGPRNHPAQTFFNDLAHNCRLQGSDKVSAGKLAEVKFNPLRDCKENAPETTAPRSNTPEQKNIYQYIASELTSASAILSAMRRKRSDCDHLTTPYVAPAANLERAVTTIWEDVLKIAPIGAQDSFQALGGKSLHLVQIHSRLEMLLGQKIEITILFQHATISQLVAALTQSGQTDANFDRASAMRDARRRQGARMKTVRAARKARGA